MSSKTAKHWDSKGKPVLDFFAMKDYYSNDKESLEVLRKYPPHLYMVIPTQEIRFQKSHPETVTQYDIYPAGQESRIVELDKKQIAWLRDIWRGKYPAWSAKIEGDTVVLRKPGKLSCNHNSPYLINFDTLEA